MSYCEKLRIITYCPVRLSVQQRGGVGSVLGTRRGRLAVAIGLMKQID
jgi:hypothetical protein